MIADGGTKILAQSDKTQIRFLSGNGWALFYSGTIFLDSCSIFSVLKRALCRKQNTRRDGEEENSGSGKSNLFYVISGYDRFFHG